MPDLRNLSSILRASSLKLTAVATALAMTWGNADPLSAQQSSAQQPKKSSVAVLNDGRIFQGWMTEVPGGYRIEQPDGKTVILPFDQISVTAINLVGAYEAYRDSIRTPSAEAHLMLAEWCVTNGLWAQAYAEVQSALKLEPNRSEAIALLQKLDQIVQTQQPQLTPQKLQMAPVQQIAHSTPAERTPSGTHRNLQRDFVDQVQPLLMNACGNGNCHGQTSNNQFKLTNVRLSSRNLRQATESNVRVLLEWIDFDNPTQSPLLVKPCEKTRHHQNIFAMNRHGQYKILEQWVLETTRDRPTGMAPQSSSPSRIQPASYVSPADMKPTANLQQTAAQTLTSPSQTVPTATTPVEPTPESLLIQNQNSPELQQIRKQIRKDAFDPNAFNQMMHNIPATGSP